KSNISSTTNLLAPTMNDIHSYFTTPVTDSAPLFAGTSISTQRLWRLQQGLCLEPQTWYQLSLVPFMIRSCATIWFVPGSYGSVYTQQLTLCFQETLSLP